MFSGSVIVEITIKGQGGHGSSPHLLRDPITPAAYIHTQLHAIKSRTVDSKKTFVFTICHFRSGHTFNVFPDSAFLQGTIRYYDMETADIVKKRIKEIAEAGAEAHQCTADVNLIDLYPPTVNHKEQADHVTRVATKCLPAGYCTDQDLPLTASEDFSYYLHERPGAFIFIGSGKPGEKMKTLHTSTYDFNDNVMATGAYVYLKLVEDRLGVKLLA